jgi:hypothetical protein
MKVAGDCIPLRTIALLECKLIRISSGMLSTLAKTLLAIVAAPIGPWIF